MDIIDVQSWIYSAWDLHPSTHHRSQLVPEYFDPPATLVEVPLIIHLVQHEAGRKMLPLSLKVTTLDL